MHSRTHTSKQPSVTKIYLPQTAAVFHPWRCAAGCPDGLEQAAELVVEWHPAPAKVRDLLGKGQGFESIQQSPTQREDLVYNITKSQAALSTNTWESTTLLYSEPTMPTDNPKLKSLCPAVQTGYLDQRPVGRWVQELNHHR